VRLPAEIIGQLRTGDLILASDVDEPVQVVDDVRGPGWSTVGVVVRPSDFGIPSGPGDVLVYAPEEDELARLSSRVEPLPEATGTVVLCPLDRSAAGQAVDGLATRIGARTRTVGADPLLDKLRGTLAGRSGSPGIVTLPGWPRYLDPSPLSPRRSCGEEGCRFSRPCPVHG
jgi:hypothetical protein